MRSIYTSIDMGSDSVKIVVCELYRGRYNLLATTSVKSSGIKKGLITDIYEAKKSLHKALGELEGMLNFKIKKVIANVPSYFSEFVLIKGEVNVSLVTVNDITKVIKEAVGNNKDEQKEIVTVIPIDYKLDEKLVKEPVGLTGEKLSIRAIMAATHKKNIYSVVSLLNSLNLEVVDISLGCIGDVFTYKTKETEEEITAVVNIGHEKTEVSLFNKGIIVKHEIIPKGSINVDSDIAYMYKVDISTARMLKEKFAFAHKSNASLSEIKEVRNKQGELIKINQLELTEVVSSRIDQILTLANNELSNFTSHKPSTIYVTGGITNMVNFNNICSEKLGTCAIIGCINLIGLRNNKYSSALGSIIYFVNKLKNKEYTMITEEEMEILSTPRKTNNDSVFGKVFDYFFGE